jgi:hypothetical protein
MICPDANWRADSIADPVALSIATVVCLERTRRLERPLNPCLDPRAETEDIRKSAE